MSDHITNACSGKITSQEARNLSGASFSRRLVLNELQPAHTMEQA